MGAWGVEIMSNDTSLDFEDAFEGFQKGHDTETAMDMAIEDATKWRGDEGTVGVAMGWLVMKHGLVMTEARFSQAKSALKIERGDIDSWDDPEDRTAELDKFERFLCDYAGEPVDIERGKGLFEKIKGWLNG